VSVTLEVVVVMVHNEYNPKAEYEKQHDKEKLESSDLSHQVVADIRCRWKICHISFI
jgi:hypothetical protein